MDMFTFLLLAVTIPFWVPFLAVLGALAVLFFACVYAGAVEVARAAQGVIR